MKLRLHAPIHLLVAKEHCYRCGKYPDVAALACEHCLEIDEEEDDEPMSPEPVLVHDLVHLPDELLRAIRAIQPNFDRRYSKMAGSEYFMNLCCYCQAQFGDFFLFSEPDGAFFPTDDASTAAIRIHTLPLRGTYEVDGLCGYGLAEEILRLGKRT